MERRRIPRCSWLDGPVPHPVPNASLPRRRRHDIDFRPYVLARASQSKHDSAGTELGGAGLGGKVGADAKFAISSTLTADLTANTDFAQVEVDQQVINLTQFPTFFPEKREFFLESSGIFDLGTDQK